MKKSTSHTCSVIDKKLARYSKMAGATLAAAGAGSADAAIVHVTGSPVSMSGPNSSLSWNVDGVGGSEFNFFQSFYLTTITFTIGSTCVSFTSPYSSDCNNYEDIFTTTSSTVVNALFGSGAILQDASTNTVVSSNDSFFSFNTVTWSSNAQAPFVNGQQLIGFTFQNGMGTNLYGWADITVGPQSLTISEWAYNDMGAAITKGAIPEPSSMALLAAGAAGFGLYRRRRKVAKS